MVLDELKKIISEKLGVDEADLTADTNLTDDIHADSLDKVEFIMQVEEVYGITIDDEAAINFRTIGDVADYIEAHKKDAKQLAGRAPLAPLYYASVAQLDRASPSDGEGCGFKSRRVHHDNARLSAAGKKEKSCGFSFLFARFVFARFCHGVPGGIPTE